jgi:hypothetical protein
MRLYNHVLGAVLVDLDGKLALSIAVAHKVEEGE